jgi:hypothetical protein
MIRAFIPAALVSVIDSTASPPGMCPNGARSTAVEAAPGSAAAARTNVPNSQTAIPSSLARIPYLYEYTQRNLEQSRVLGTTHKLSGTANARVRIFDGDTGGQSPASILNISPEAALGSRSLH